MSRFTRARAYLALGIAATLNGCAHKAPVVTLAPPVETIPPRPEPPAYLGAIVPPARDADGDYRTINHGIGAQQAMWHVRAALNVAAIGCRGTDGGAALTAAYNARLQTGSKESLVTRRPPTDLLKKKRKEKRKQRQAKKQNRSH